jgi:pSer/pThr/pTyr-binding forkhead associated (FHA) protein
MPKLWVILDGKRYSVNKSQFVIGRGANETDLLIVDTNVSRRHAQVVLHQGYFFIQDLGSTNGVRFEGSRVDTRRIDEGDRFEICEHQLTFTYRDLGAA